MTPSIYKTAACVCAFVAAALLPLASQAQPAAELASLTNSVVKIFATSRQPDPFKPWAKQGPRDATGSGVVIEGNRILTNAHVVAYASQVQVQGNGSGDKLNATVVAIAPGIDLAVLKLENDSFFRNHAPLARATILPAIKDTVLAYGFPTGGASLSITKGIVSRIEYATYNAPVGGLRIQIDAAINPGNSGGPAVADDKMIGLAFAGVPGAQSIGYIIPNTEIEMFLKDIEDGKYDGKSFLQDDLQRLENPALRKYLKLDANVKGMVVNRPHKEDAAYPLKKWDVITHVGDAAVDDQGMVKSGADLRLSLRYQVQKTVANGTLPLTVWRNGKSIKVALPVDHERPMLIPDLKGDYPSYFVYGPIVFSKATLQFVSFMGTGNSMAAFSAIRSPLVTERSAWPTPEREELVVIAAPFFPHRLSTGYNNATAMVIRSVNGTPVRSLRHLVTLLRDMKDEFVTFETDNKGGETLVFSHKEMVAASEDILSDNSVRAQGSPELMELWQGRVAR